MSITLFPATLFAQQDYYVVTAYYSPLPGQDYYAMGSYHADIILNWEWIAGASGRKVFSGMLAAPQGYAFGTKIYLDWLGIGSVEDRWGAIVPAWERGFKHDRIDVWMGYGDEWLRRAMYWGKRTVAGNIVNWNSDTTINYYNIPTPAWTVAGFKKQYYNTAPTPVVPAKLPGIFEVSLESGSNATLVSKLQSILWELWYLDEEENTWEYDEITLEAVFQFQVDSQILASKEDAWAGRYGPKTRAALQKSYDAHLQEITKKETFLSDYKKLQESSQVKAQEYIDSLWTPEYGDISSQVRELQKTLARLGYFSHKDTAIFGVKTQNAIIDYQIAQNLIQSSNDIGAWKFWPKTRWTMVERFEEIYLEEALDSQGLQEDFNLYIKPKETVAEEISKILDLSTLWISI